MENQSHIVVALIFVVFFGAGAVGFYFWLSNGDNAHRTLVIETQHTVSGVSSQSPVKFKGLKVGHIETVDFAPNDPSTVRIVFKVRSSVPLNQSSYAQLATQGITGLSSLSLSTPNPSAAPLTAKNVKPPRLPLHRGLLSRLKSQGQADLGKINTILTQVKNLTGGQNARHISQTLARIDRATQKLTQTEKAIQPTIQQLPALTQQLQQTVTRIDQLSRQAVPAIKQARAAAKSAQNMGSTGQRAMQQLNNRILPQIDALTQQVGAASRQIQQLSAELSAKPQSVLLGPPARRPGPGEPGFKPGH